MRMRTTLALALLFGIGALSGTAFATPTLTGGLQTPLPVAQPAFGLYAAPIPVTPSDTILEVRLGRDDTMLYASINVAFVTPPAPCAAVQLLTFRPLWDAPLLPGLGGGVFSYQAQWTACEAFARAARDLREAMRYSRPASMLCFIDPASAIGGPLHSYEFYKFDITY